MRKRNRKKFKVSSELVEVIDLLNLLPDPSFLIDTPSINEKVQKHIDGHSSLIKEINRFGFRSCCYFFLKKQLKTLDKKLIEFIFSIKAGGMIFPPPEINDFVRGSFTGEPTLLNRFPGTGVQQICFGALSKYEELINSQKFLLTVVNFNEALTKNKQNTSRQHQSPEYIWALQGENKFIDLPRMVLKVDQHGIIREEIPFFLKVLLRSDTTRFGRCEDCHKFFWMSRIGRKFCGTNCRQNNHQFIIKKKALDTELIEKTIKLETEQKTLDKLRTALSPNSNLIKEREEKVKEIEVDILKLEERKISLGEVL